MKAGIVEHNCLVRKPQSFGSAREASPVPAPNIGVGDIVASLQNAEADALNVEFGIAQRNVNEKRAVPRNPCSPHNTHCAVTGEGRFQRKALAIHEQRFAPAYRLAGGGNCRSGRMSSIKAACNCVGIY
jgi:hypothetical protein